MSAAWDADGVVVGVLSQGLDRALRLRENRAAVLEGRALLCSPYSPSAGFSVGNAMARNKIVYAQSSAAFVVATDEGSGGTWAGATEALSKGYAPVAVWMGDDAGPGNAALVKQGATPVEAMDELADLLAAPETLSAAPHLPTRQRQPRNSASTCRCSSTRVVPLDPYRSVVLHNVDCHTPFVVSVT
jgi:predicted Rossmann fold nucleotide-binding protein DprA/Smf involved in DNA uptake